MDSILSISDLSIAIRKRTIMSDVSFHVDEGETVLLSGSNGIGKSTLLKSIIRLETEEKIVKGNICVRGFGNVLDLDASELQKFRSSIAYIPQRDEYSEMGNIQVRDIISENGEPHSGMSLSISEVNDLIDEWIPRRDDNSRVFDAKSRPAKFSGGEQRLLSVLSIVATRPKVDLLIIDEPLNNLDFINARNISNLINRVIKANPRMGVLMISHCRIFPFITREIKLTANGIQMVSERYKCHSCFGEHNEDGYYQV